MVFMVGLDSALWAAVVESHSRTFRLAGGVGQCSVVGSKEVAKHEFEVRPSFVQVEVVGVCLDGLSDYLDLESCVVSVVLVSVDADCVPSVFVCVLFEGVVHVRSLSVGCMVLHTSTQSIDKE